MNDLVTISKKDLEETIHDVVGKSYNSISAVASNSVQDFKVQLTKLDDKLQRLEEHIIEVKEYQKKQNGNVARAVADIDKLQTSKTTLEASIKGAKTVWKYSISIIIGLTTVLGSLGVYAYTGDKKALDLKTETVAEELAQYQKQTSNEMQQIIQLLKQR